MSQFTVRIDTDNDAFADDPGSEIARVLRAMAMNIQLNGLTAGYTQTIADWNGNTVGRADWEQDGTTSAR